MAMVKCPECGKEISESAESCPNCGYVLVRNELPKVRRTQIYDAAPDEKSGNMLIFGGVSFIVLGIVTIFFVIGIIFIPVGIGLIFMGNKERSGKCKKASCPYCGNEITVESYETTVKCPHCRKISTHKENYLETIE